MVENSFPNSEPIVAHLVPESERVEVLPRHFGLRSMLKVEFALYDSLRSIASDYQGGYRRSVVIEGFRNI